MASRVCVLVCAFTPPPQSHTTTEVQNIKPKDSTQPQRSKVTVSDGMYKCTALLASQLARFVEGGQIARGAVVRVTELVGNKKLGPAGSNKK